MRKARRRIAQLAAFAACNAGLTAALKTGLPLPFMYCHGCPLAAFACPIGALQNLVGMRRAPFLLLGTLLIAFLLMGRLGCGWLCPFGALQDLLARGGGKESGLRGGGLSWRLRPVKMLVLGALVLASYLMAGPSFCWLCPIGALFAGIPYLILYGPRGLGPAFYIHMAVLAAVLAASIRVPRFWCRYLCPLGALAGLFNRISLVRVELDEEACVRCLACLGACPMGLRELGQVGLSPECVLCCLCSEVCPAGAIKLTLG